MNYYKIHINDSEVVNCYLEGSFYQVDHRFLAAIAHEVNEGPYAKLTVYLDIDLKDIIKIEPGFTFLNTVEYMPWMEQFVIENKLATPVKYNNKTIICQSGFNQYPLYKFDIDKVFDNDLELKELYLSNFK